jgi:bifunctional NMN adenylyltransferase/nudix hydrolase
MIDAYCASSFHHEIASRIKCIPNQDFYDDNDWIAYTKSQIGNVDGKCALIGHDKDSSSFYLHCFPEWDFIEGGNADAINATDIRNELFANRFPNTDIPSCPPVVLGFLDKWVSTPVFETLYHDYQFTTRYKDSFACCPYPPIHHTVDCVVFKDNYILLIKRKFSPGKDMWALPGGFVGQNERLIDAAVRELEEETGIFAGWTNIFHHNTFDDPSRSCKGRVITTAYSMMVPSDTEVTPGDDACDYKWVDLSDIPSISTELYDDHLLIIQYFVGWVVKQLTTTSAQEIAQ